MSGARILPRIVHGMTGAVLVIALAGVSLGACNDGHDAFDRKDTFATDASFDAPDCGRQCSLDGRSIIDSCTGVMLKECSAELACGAGECMEPCAAAAADRSSNGCDFYFQAPLYGGFYPSCYASYIVNTSAVPVNVSLEYEGQQIDISKSLYRTEPGSADLVSHTGPIPAGESAILFLLDSPPARSAQLRRGVGYGAGLYAGCPKEVVPAVVRDGRWYNSAKIGSSFRLAANVPVSLSTIYPFGGARSYLPTATLVLPLATWSKENMIVNGWSDLAGPSVQITASEDDTELTVLPTNEIQDGEGIGGGPAREPITYRLNRGQFLQLVQNEELTGSLVTSSKPVAIFGGHSCAVIPSGATACDVLQQHIPPPAQWGAEYVGVGYRPRLGDEHELVPYRIVAARDGTQLDYDPAIPEGAPTTLNAGEVATFRSGAGDAVVVRTQDAEHPVYLSAHMTGAGGGGFAKSQGGNGDPEFVNVVPALQYLNSYSFYADPVYSDTSLVIVRKKTRGEFKDVWLECAGNLTAAKGKHDIGFRPVGTRGEYEFMRVDLARGGEPGDAFGASTCRTGLQRMRSDGPFTATVWGWDYYSSYAYPGGMAQRKLADSVFTK